MKTLDDITFTTPLIESVDSGILQGGLQLGRDVCGRIEALPPVKQHLTLEDAEKRIHQTCDTRRDLIANVAYSLLLQYHSALFAERFRDFIDCFGPVAWTRDFDVNYLGGKTAYNAPRMHAQKQSIIPDGFNKVAEAHYLRAARDWAPIEQSHYAQQKHPMAYRYARWAIINFHLYRLGLERQQCTAEYFANAIAAARTAGEITLPWSKDFSQVKNTLNDLAAWVREHQLPQREDYLRTLDTIRERLNVLELRRDGDAQPSSLE